MSLFESSDLFCASKELAEHTAASNLIQLSLQLGHLRLQVGLLRSQVGLLRLQVGHLRSQVGLLRSQVGHLRTQSRFLCLKIGHSRLEADFGLLNICQLPLGLRQLVFELGRGALRTGQLGPEKTHFEGEEFVFHP